MMKLHPEVLEKNGKKHFVVLPYEEFLAIKEELADLQDLRDLREAKRREGKTPGIPLTQVRRMLEKR